MRSNIIVLACEELKRIMSYNRNVAVMLAFFLFVSFVPIFVLKQGIQELPTGVASPAQMLREFTRLFFFTYSVSLVIFLIHAISMDIFISDKKEGALVFLLTTPIGLKNLWLAKSLALFILGYSTTLLSTLVFVICANLILLGKVTCLPDSIMVFYLFSVLPVLIFSTTTLAGLGQIIARRFSAINFFLFLIAFVVMGIPSFLVNRLTVVNTSVFFWIYSGVTVFVVITVVIAQKIFLNKERVVLSS